MSEYTIFLKDGILTISFLQNLLKSEAPDGFMDEFILKLNVDTKGVIIDLKEVSYTNSSGLGLFLRILNKTRVKGGDVAIINCHESVKKLFKITKLDQVFHIFDNAEMATEYLTK